MKTCHVSLLIALALGTATLASASVRSSHNANNDRAFPESGSALLTVLDRDGDGVISAAELTYAAITLHALDLDGDGIVTSAEMSAPLRTRGSRGTEVAMVQFVVYHPAADFNLLHHLDANQDGVLQPLEIANAASSLRQLDRNGDGALTRDELLPRRRA